MAGQSASRLRDEKRMAVVASDGAERRRGPDRRRGSSVLGEVFEELPHGLLVVGDDGTLLIANDVARRMLMRAGHALGPATRCCDLFGCGGPHEPDGCVTEILRAGGRPPTDLRVVPPGHAAGDPALSAKLLRHDHGRLVLELVEGEARLQAEGALDVSEPTPGLWITALGQFRVRAAEGPLDGSWFDQRAGEVLQYLVCERRRAVPTDEIAEAVWPTARMSSVGNVRFAIHELRNRLEPERPRRGRSAFVISGKGRYQLDRRNVHVDADEFDQAVDEGFGLLVTGRSAAAAATLDRALDLYRGEFLSDVPYAPWAALERARLHQQAVRALRLRSELALQAGDLQLVLSHTERLAALEPFDMEIQQDLIATCLRLGRYGQASRSYSDLRRRMLHEFGQPPPFELVDLFEQDDHRQLSLG
jgi:DNA-binding SARP family transcriptional activator